MDVGIVGKFSTIYQLNKRRAMKIFKLESHSYNLINRLFKKKIHVEITFKPYIYLISISISMCN